MDAHEAAREGREGPSAEGLVSRRPEGATLLQVRGRLLSHPSAALRLYACYLSEVALDCPWTR